MKIPNWLKITLWLVLIGFFTWLLSQRYNTIINGTSNTTDIIILLIWIALIAALIFQEVDFFGVKLKREIDNLKTEFKEQIINLRSDIQTINMNTEISPRFTFGAPSTDSELRNLERNVKPLIEQSLKEHGIDKSVTVKEELDVPSDIVFLFKVRYALDKELGRITNRWWTPPEERRYESSLRAAINLAERGVLVPASLKLIREVYAICSSAIHGEDVTEASVKFVKDAASILLQYLKSIEKQPPSWQSQQWRDWMKKPPKEPKT